MIPVVAYRDLEQRLSAILNRSATFSTEIDARVAEIIAGVRARGDEAVLDFTERFDGVRPATIRVGAGLLEEAYEQMDRTLREVIARAADNVRRFHVRQRREAWIAEDGDGVVLGQRYMPLDRAGVYVPGGKAFYPSSLIMNVVPAQVAGVGEIHLVSPPQADGRPHPLVMATAHFLGIEHVYAVGGAQAVAALAFGTETVQNVDKIVGPGNVYVAAAKKQVYGPVAIDSVAGPSEIVVLADHTADPRHVAADLLAQAEHDERASAVLVTTEADLAEAVRAQIDAWWPQLQRKEILTSSLPGYSACVVVPDEQTGIDLVNRLAPEHLELIVEDPWATMGEIRHAGAIFLGPYSSEPVGDYFAGPNHVLPTGGTARYASALGVDDFIRRQSIISYSAKRLAQTGQDIIRFAEAEHLP
ncbi:MAG: histidinol dehydrogenase, partial [Bacteroidota bacterium]